MIIALLRLATRQNYNFNPRRPIGAMFTKNLPHEPAEAVAVDGPFTKSFSAGDSDRRFAVAAPSQNR